MYTYQANGRSFFQSTLFKVLLMVLIFIVLSPGFLLNVPGRDHDLDEDSNSITISDCKVVSTPVGDIKNESLYLQAIVHGLVFAIVLLLRCPGQIFLFGCSLREWTGVEPAM